MDYLPVFLDLRDRRVLVIGGGEVALRKIAMLRRAGALVRVVAPELHPELETMRQAGVIEHVAQRFEAAHMEEASFAVAATDDPTINQAVSDEGRRRHLFVNAVDDGSASSALMPAIVDRSPLIVAVGSAGSSPTLVRRVRAELESMLPQSLGQLAAAAARARSRVRELLPDLPRRRRFWERFYGGAAALDAPAAADPLQLDAALDRALQQAAQQTPRGEVWLIGAGPGDPDLMTLRALQLLQQCDVVLYDRLVSAEILDRVRRDAERVFVGKESGRHRTTQARIHELMLDYARRGLRVARLKGGDPMVFGRGGEELQALARGGIPVTVVPGVTAALGAAAMAQIPLTHRGVAQSVTFVTAMGEAAEALDWRALAAPLQTTVFYMGVAQLARIVERLSAHGAPAGRAVAIIERASLPDQRVIVGTLGDIVALSAQHQVAAPALLLVGDVARLASRDWHLILNPGEHQRA